MPTTVVLGIVRDIEPTIPDAQIVAIVQIFVLHRMVEEVNATVRIVVIRRVRFHRRTTVVRLQVVLGPDHGEKLGNVVMDEVIAIVLGEMHKTEQSIRVTQIVAIIRIL